MNHVRAFLSVESAAFATAALVHAGVVAEGYEHREATIAESVIAAVLVIGLVAAVVVPRWGRAFALAVQGFALAGTLVGIFTIVMGIGPQSTFDVLLHASFVALLVCGLFVVARCAQASALPGSPVF